VIGLHFFNPVPKMPLVEVVRRERRVTTRRCATLSRSSIGSGKTPILVNDAPDSSSTAC
jgi:3-hydroxyacyl-CoA dehydrogenase/enoyl-CoA hydratase/3-hydroxybutyryl-CoA epimerase/enoyl-CoA isomerase